MTKVGPRVEPAATHSLLAPWEDARTVVVRDRVSLDGRELEVQSATNVDEANINVRLLCNEAK